ncbi:IS200/IS605 family element transposase accessory protein TnpB [Haloarcula sp. JP-Z28]|uniref:RNA-guided endonuclease InsQ/TnpB family protein n=1 Tax=Haloarcula sp. JP-Z28 TaxID=2716715 RepID=UPI00140447A5|nr:RNA-guided endonuclease TnpB family protein [Haloarcula sp. JP-Z28]NHN64338.1 IS200/IS605 family element transposase accessory protein TnpB [Haloarcula sp. JP-Z28]
MEVRRTAPVKIVVPDEYRDDLHETTDQFLYCANEASDYCWDNTDYEDCVTSNVKARDALYDRLREETDLTANLVQEAIRRAVHAVDSGVDRWKKGKRTNKPEFTSWSMVYDKRSATFYRNKISLSTVNGRIECDFELPADSLTPYEEYVLSEDYEFRTSTLQYDQATSEFYFHVKTRKIDTDGEPVEAEGSDDTGHQTVLGIDLGVNSLAVASTGTFWSGDEYDHWIQEFEKRRAEMQQRGTQAAHNALLRLGKRERAWRKQYIHTVANDIVAEAVDTDCDVIVFEDLTDIRERLPHADWHHVWAFRRLIEYVEYKAPEHGVAVEQVEPDHTSQRCSHTDCGFTHEDNRDGEQFQCLKCGYEINADYNGSKNVGLRYMRKRQHRLRSSPTSGSADAPVDVRINGGTLNGDGYRPTADS